MREIQRDKPGENDTEKTGIKKKRGIKKLGKSQNKAVTIKLCGMFAKNSQWQTDTADVTVSKEWNVSTLFRGILPNMMV